MEPRRILVVDDNRDAAVSLAALLRAYAHDTEAVHGGEEGVHVGARYRPDVVLLDIGMPKLNSYDAWRAIRAQADGRDVRIIALTGWGQEHDRRRSQEAGFDAHLIKPVEASRLAE